MNNIIYSVVVYEEGIMHREVRTINNDVDYLFHVCPLKVIVIAYLAGLT